MRPQGATHLCSIMAYKKAKSRFVKFVGFSPKDSDKNFVKAILVLIETLRRLHARLSAKWKGTVVQNLSELILRLNKLYSCQFNV